MFAKKMKTALVTLVATLAVVVAASANAAIVIDSNTSLNAPGGAESTFNYGNYDASTTDKLIVLVGASRDRDSVVSINSVTYNGVALTEAVQASSLDISPQGEGAGIFYLDNPGAAGDIVVNLNARGWGARNSISVLEVSGADVGHGPVNSSNTSGSTSVTTLVADALVLAVASAQSGSEVPQAPLSDLNGSRHGAGSALVATPSLVNVNFADSGSSAGDGVVVTAVAVFNPVPVPTPAALPAGLAILAIIAARRR